MVFVFRISPATILLLSHARTRETVCSQRRKPHRESDCCHPLLARWKGSLSAWEVGDKRSAWNREGWEKALVLPFWAKTTEQDSSARSSRVVAVVHSRWTSSDSACSEQRTTARAKWSSVRFGRSIRQEGSAFRHKRKEFARADRRCLLFRIGLLLLQNWS